MFELFKKTMVTGLGAMLFTKEKAEELVNELVEQGRINRQEAEEIIEDLVAEIEKESNETKNRMKQELRGLLDKMGLKNDEEITKLKGEIKDLELELEALKEEVEELKANKDSGKENAITEIDDE
ncbi:phasin family protein [Acetohalobium arabaticum]|uniref:Polyhydroxyalkanoate synthesis regulator phasin n=1 Tax=Acetohalobium arabaticum (strain ATCC 49924 / DSM 5501 / Z-7288) TaxID=574087 RepID=D9QVJ3_ACEAZ|nr:hypothetical protein [Acetohalobium arabaticum]ADL12252.1 conserved hypothetical protein [Acetohalobium arabaticum DSM 5501]